MSIVPPMEIASQAGSGTNRPEPSRARNIFRCQSSLESAWHRRCRQCQFLRHLRRHTGGGGVSAFGLSSLQRQSRPGPRPSRAGRCPERTALGPAHRSLGRSRRAVDRPRRDGGVARGHGVLHRAVGDLCARRCDAGRMPSGHRPARRQRQRLQRPRHHGLVPRGRAWLCHEHQADGGAARRRARRAGPAVAGVRAWLRRGLRAAGGGQRRLGAVCLALAAPAAGDR